MLLLLRNIEPNSRDELDNPCEKVTNLDVLPHMEQYHGLVEKGFGFFYSFKAMSKGIPGAKKMQVFSILLE